MPGIRSSAMAISRATPSPSTSARVVSGIIDDKESGDTLHCFSVDFNIFKCASEDNAVENPVIFRLAFFPRKRSPVFEAYR